MLCLWKEKNYFTYLDLGRHHGHLCLWKKNKTTRDISICFWKYQDLGMSIYLIWMKKTNPKRLIFLKEKPTCVKILELELDSCWGTPPDWPPRVTGTHSFLGRGGTFNPSSVGQPDGATPTTNNQSTSRGKEGGNSVCLPPRLNHDNLAAVWVLAIESILFVVSIWKHVWS